MLPFKLLDFHRTIVHSFKNLLWK